MHGNKENRPTRKCIWIAGDATGVPDVLEIGRRCQSRHETRLTPHIHGPDRMEIAYLHKGRKQFAVGGRKYALKGGDVLVIGPGELHGGIGKLEERGLLYWVTLKIPPPGKGFLGFPVDLTRELLQFITPPRQNHFRGAFRLRDHVEGMIAAALQMKKNRVARLAVHAHLLLFLLELAKCSCSRTRQRLDWKDHLLTHIESNLSEPLSVAGMAAASRLSVSAFERRFTKEVGFSPADYILRRRIDIARDLLAGTSTSITEIAFELGFSSSQYFATVFKRYTGLAPRDARKSKRSDG
ncbi:MAG: hypothetical protein C0404_05065 [Verrucomicrobia bacterium]|nr:hypothetical protein [Verrucomicrobiota bacterium]